MWISLLKKKTEAFDAFKKFKSLVEAENSMKIGCLRIDQGGEFNLKEFSKFCYEHGIRRQLIVPYSTQQNGVVEKHNYTILDMVRPMSKSKNLYREFWGEAGSTIVDLLNRAPTKSLENQTICKEAWIWQKASS